jgi:predicted DNA-binding transcriptional regulator AlpA
VNATAENPATLDDIAGLLRKLVAATKPPSPMMDRAELAELLHAGETKLDEMRAAGTIGPAEIRVGRSVLWNRAEVLAWLSRPIAPKGELMTAKAWAVYWREEQRRKSK